MVALGLAGASPFAEVPANAIGDDRPALAPGTGTPGGNGKHRPEKFCSSYRSPRSVAHK